MKIEQALDGNTHTLTLIPCKTAIKQEYSEKNDECSKFECQRKTWDKMIIRVLGSIFYRKLTDITQVYPKGSYAHIPLKPCDRGLHSLQTGVYAMRFANEIGLDGLFCYLAQLVHDAGHIPFAHPGGLGLNQQLKKLGLPMFDHDRQGLRIINILERFSPNYRGINPPVLLKQFLVNRCGRTKNAIDEIRLPKDFPKGLLTLEEQVCAIFDKFFLVHDIQDMIKFDKRSIRKLSNMQIPILSEICFECLKDNACYPIDIAKSLYNKLLKSLYNYIEKTGLKKVITKFSGNYIASKSKLINYEPEVEKDFADLLGWMYKNVYAGGSQERILLEERMTQLIKILFDYLYADNVTKKQVQRILKFNANIIDIYSTPKKVSEFPPEVVIPDVLSMVGESYTNWFVKTNII